MNTTPYPHCLSVCTIHLNFSGAVKQLVNGVQAHSSRASSQIGLFPPTLTLHYTHAPTMYHQLHYEPDSHPATCPFAYWLSRHCNKHYIPSRKYSQSTQLRESLK